MIHMTSAPASKVQLSSQRRNQRCCAILLALLCGFIAAIPLEVRSAALVEWLSSESLTRFEQASHKTDFFPLSNHFISQDNAIYCGPVSSAIVLNALRLGKKGGLPVDRSSITHNDLAWLPEGADPFFGKYTPYNVLNEKTKTKPEVLGKPIVVNGALMNDFGLQLHQLAQVLRSHDLRVETRVVHDDKNSQTIRDELIANLGNADDFVLVNYSRKALGQKGGGHISPLGAYDENSDSFLIMDVNPNRAPWVWVATDDLIRAMRTFDTVENRGYLLLSEME